jgi:histidine triad (HIT) family protein
MPAGELNADCVFCKIIRGQIPSQRVFDDEHVLAFLDISPLAAGHTVVVPKHHIPSLEDLPADWSARLGVSFGPIARAVVRTVSAEGFNLIQNNGVVAGQIVPHVHFHLVPRCTGDGLGYRWKSQSASAAELAALAERIRAAF